MTSRDERDALVKRMVEMHTRLLSLVVQHKIGDQFDGDFDTLDEAVAALTAQPAQEPVANAGNEWIAINKETLEGWRSTIHNENLEHGDRLQRISVRIKNILSDVGRPVAFAPPSGEREGLAKRLQGFVSHFKFADDNMRGEAMSLLTELRALTAQPQGEPVAGMQRLCTEIEELKLAVKGFMDRGDELLRKVESLEEAR